MSSSTGSNKLWGGRFSQPTHELVDQLNASLPFDRRFARHDIIGSIAHATMLGRQGIITEADAQAIVAGLRQVLEEVEGGTFVFDVADEDIHMAVERRLHALIGPTAGRLHTARSRNDQVALDFRMWTREAIATIALALLDAADAALRLGSRYATAIMPGYTHLQRAQPILFAHHTHAWAVMFLRDIDRLADAYRRVNVSPLGSAALAGVTHPIDRQLTAHLLGFAGTSSNSLDAVSDRDFVIETLAAFAVIAMHLSRIAEELILWTTSEFGFAEMADAFSTGSSIMPQKKNADVAELMRGKSGRVYGHLMGMLTVAKGLPLTYNKDLQEDKEGFFDAYDTVLALLRVLPPMLDTLTMRPERMATAAIGGFSLATDVADELARRGVPFREAHEIVGRLVAQCVAHERTLESLDAAEWAAVHPVFAETPPDVTLAASVNARDIPGGTAPRQVALAYQRAHDDISTWRARITDWTQALEQIDAVGSHVHR
ncbi:MAG: argininosuccinate lyase [Chloroflexi bacterium]|nr:MAG: argininosuccinate lyase [Chloroflexota bacterium]